jgi:hypothetical protein
VRARFHAARVIRVGLPMRRSLPVFPHEQTSATSVGTLKSARTGHQVAAGQSFNCYRTMATIEVALRFGEAEWKIGDDFSSMELLCS